MRSYVKNFSAASAAALATAIDTFLQDRRLKAVSISVVNNGGTWEGFLVYHVF